MPIIFDVLAAPNKAACKFAALMLCTNILQLVESSISDALGLRQRPPPLAAPATRANWSCCHCCREALGLQTGLASRASLPALQQRLAAAATTSSAAATSATAASAALVELAAVR